MASNPRCAQGAVGTWIKIAPGRRSGKRTLSSSQRYEWPMIIEIKALSANYHTAWLPLWHGYQAFYQVDIAEAVTQSTWSRMLDPSEPMHGALAVADGKAVGLVHFLFHRSTWSIS